MVVCRDEKEIDHLLVVF